MPQLMSIFAHADTGNWLLIYLRNFHVLRHLLLIYTCKLHWNRRRQVSQAWYNWATSPKLTRDDLPSTVFTGVNKLISTLSKQNERITELRHLKSLVPRVFIAEDFLSDLLMNIYRQLQFPVHVTNSHRWTFTTYCEFSIWTVGWFPVRYAGRRWLWDHRGMTKNTQPALATRTHPALNPITRLYML